ncbi:MAG: hypothetical protein AAGA75_13835 [Cyanobacteria bacterium P01_E01_bin.6]
MSWLKLTNDKLQLFEGSRELDHISTEKLDEDTLALDIPLDWLRSDNAPTQMIISIDQPSETDS